MADSWTPDSVDRKMIDLLVRDGRRTLADIGAQVGLSAPAVKRRLERLDALAHLRVSNVRELTRVIDPLRRSGRLVGTKTLMVLDTRA